MRTYLDLPVWRRSMQLVAACYRVSQPFPKHELYGLTGQLRRAAISIPSNIAEGNGRRHRKEDLQHLAIAQGSLNELDTLMRVAVMLGYIDPESAGEVYSLASETGRMLTAMRRALS